ncbi:hypothetical protein [Streptomyces sp. NPDC056492]|uniref:hypothetical protein n=2 Tax=Streptomyces TaxID=1883 RepID=UPI0036960BE6
MPVRWRNAAAAAAAGTAAAALTLSTAGIAQASPSNAAYMVQVDSLKLQVIDDDSWGVLFGPIVKSSETMTHTRGAQTARIVTQSNPHAFMISGCSSDNGNGEVWAEAVVIFFVDGQGKLQARIREFLYEDVSGSCSGSDILTGSTEILVNDPIVLSGDTSSVSYKKTSPTNMDLDGENHTVFTPDEPTQLGEAGVTSGHIARKTLGPVGWAGQDESDFTSDFRVWKLR